MSDPAPTPKLPLHEIALPITRVRMIMKSSPEVTNINHESVFLIAKATELFIQHLSALALRHSNKAYTIEYQDLAEVVNSRATLEFLQDIVPRKIKAKDYLELLRKEEKAEEF